MATKRVCDVCDKDAAVTIAVTFLDGKVFRGRVEDTAPETYDLCDDDFGDIYTRVQRPVPEEPRSTYSREDD